MSGLGVRPMEPATAPERQRLVIVAPTSVRWDSRTHRIAATVAARGHDVVVLARAEPDLANDEVHPAGYRILRLDVSAIDGLPLPRGLRGRLAVRWRSRRRVGPSAKPPGLPSGGPSANPSADPSHEPATRSLAGERDRRRRARQVVEAATRVARVALTVRSHRRAALAAELSADLYHGMAYMGIPVALELGRRSGVPVIYDARDIYLDAGNLARLPRPARAVVGALERRWARRATRVLTVNEGYATVMTERWGVPLPGVIMNCPDPLPPSRGRPRRFHDLLGLPPETPIVLYHGGFSPDRGIEELVEAVARLPGVHLVLMGYGSLESGLRARAARSDGRLHVLPAVQPETLLGWVASADVVAIPIQPTTLNHRLTTPNKLFEALAAGVPIVAADLPGMASIVRETGAGVLCDPTNPTSIAAAIRGLFELSEAERRAIGERGRRAAEVRYNWATQAAILLAEYGRLTGRPW